MAQARALDELGAPVHDLSAVADLDLPSSERIQEGYLRRGDPLGLGRRSLLDITGPRPGLLIDEDELNRLLENERLRGLGRVETPTPVSAEPERAVDIGEIPFFRSGDTERMDFPIENLTRKRRKALEKAMKNRRTRIARGRQRAAAQAESDGQVEEAKDVRAATEQRTSRRKARRRIFEPFRDRLERLGLIDPTAQSAGTIVSGQGQLTPDMTLEDVVPGEKGYYVKDGRVYELPEPEGVVNRPLTQPGIEPEVMVDRETQIIAAQLSGESPERVGAINRGVPTELSPEGAPRPIIGPEGVPINLMSGLGGSQRPSEDGRSLLPTSPAPFVAPDLSLDQQLTFDLDGRDLRRPTLRERAFRLMEWLDTDNQPGTALGFRLEDMAFGGRQRFVRDLDVALRLFGGGLTRTVGGAADIAADAEQLAFQLSALGEIVAPVDTPSYTRAWELGADVREMIESGFAPSTRFW